MCNLKRVLSLILAAMLIFSTVACGGNEDDPSSSTPSTSEKSELSESKSDSPYPDPNNPVKFTFFADCTWLPYDNLDGITGKEIERLTGVSFDFIKATDSEQLNLMLASGDLPDLIMTGSSAKQSKLSRSDISYAYNELIAQYAPDWEIPEIEKNINSYYSEDDNFYMLRNEFNTIDQILTSETVGPNFGQMHMREDIYKALGSPSMNNKEEFYEVLSQVKEKYPDMVPMVFNPRELGSIAQLVGIDYGMPTDENGNYSHVMSDPKYYDFMLTFNELYKNGYLLKENFTYENDDQIFQYASNGNAFIITHYAGNDDQTFTGMVKSVDENASFVQVPLMEDWNYTLGVSGWSGLFITQECQDPETAIKFMRWAKEPVNQITTMMGVQGEDWELLDDGGFAPLPKFTEALESGNKDALYTPVSFLVAATDYIRESNNFYANATPATKEIYKDATQRANWSNVVYLCYPKSGSDERIIMNDLSDLESEYLSLLGTAETQEEFDKVYNEMITIAEEIGLAQLNEYLSTTYQSLSEELGTK
ncbi:type 2 periplasmic-binding domain-containing protein [Vallitalea okinawensis]|uniref:extracellular solute-binding protein n=1 Tax=Vallitalea okinawensis TaxID=2078660 RepID=UPI000CFD7053|nr:extracellular solute-binding protein [Vallitalea okinawensis]